jgi:galactokinase
MPAQEVRQLFRDTFRSDPEAVAVAPGRVNLIGEHTDYNGGFVFPAAIDRGLFIAAARTAESSSVRSAQLGPGEEFDTAALSSGQTDSWSKYPAGMAWAISKDRGLLPNLRAVVDSEIPIGSGVSSSAAIELAFGVVWNSLEGLRVPNHDLARLGQVCENKFVGVNSGIMDQMASAMGRAGHAMFLDTRTLEIRYAPIPTGLSIVLLDTKKARALTDSAYNERRTQCEEASEILGVPQLRDADMQMLAQARSRMSEVVFKRAKHVITENERCLRFGDALKHQDFAQIGRLMRASHESLRDDYEVSCPELDAMADAAWASPGCVGARMTGAGFGGACVALIEKVAAEAFMAETLERYERSAGRSGEALICQAADGAHIIEQS